MLEPKQKSEFLEKLKYIFLIKNVSEDDNHNEPNVTMGTIVWGVLLRSALVVVVTFYLLYAYRNEDLWYVSLFVIWLFALYPGWQQYNDYNRRMEEFQESTLCGSCRNFIPDSQLCKIYDEHVTSDYIPCEGVDWEPK